jgi:hypothetical protein
MAVRLTTDRRRALALLARVVPHAVDGATLDDMTAGCELLDVTDAGEVVGAIALDVVGDVATITAAYRAGCMTADDMRGVEAIARAAGARRVRLLSRRPGLVRNMQTRYGYSLAVAELTKDL